MTSPAKAPLAIIQLGEPPAAIAARQGQQHNWFIRALALNARDYRLIRPDLGDPLPEGGTVSGAILTGSWAMVTDRAGWSEGAAAWVRTAFSQELPLFGVCYGHQLMAHALGGEVGDNPRGWEGGRQGIDLLPDGLADPLLAGLPARFGAWLSHRQTVLCPPPQARVLATSRLDDCQILRYGPQAFSVQFHPEFTAAVMDACLRASGRTATPAGPGARPDNDAEWPLALLRRFYQQP